MANRNSLRQHRRSDTVKWVIVSIVLVLLIGAVTVMGIALNKQITTRTLGASAYSIGSLDEAGEFFVKDSSCIYTKEFVTTDGLQIKLAEDAEIQYKLYFYGENDEQEKTLISVTEYLTADLDTSAIPEGAKFVKIVIDPLNDDEISSLEIRGYASQLEVTYNR
ncbi:MAG: hypothetical protein NC350_03560 [Corallococcus sp.]|nr:hypothetical protein [Corallococcus sp.]